MAVSDSDGKEVFGNITDQLLCERASGLDTDNQSNVAVSLVNTISITCNCSDFFHPDPIGISSEGNDCFVR